MAGEFRLDDWYGHLIGQHFMDVRCPYPHLLYNPSACPVVADLLKMANDQADDASAADDGEA